MWAAVVDHRHPFAKQGLQFVEEEKRVLLGSHPPGEHVRSLVCREFLQKSLPNCPKEPLDGSLVVTNTHPGGLNRDAQLTARTRQLLPHVNLAVINDHGLRHDSWVCREDTGRIQGVSID